MILSNKDKAFLRLAARAAEQSECDTKHGAVIVKGGRVLGVGWNKNKNHPLVFEDGEVACCSIHAEMDALKELRGVDNTYATARGSTIYVARINRGRQMKLSKPCPACAEFLDTVGIKKVIHT